MGLFIRFHIDKNIRSKEVVQFLKYLCQHFPKGFVLLWDSGTVHKAKMVHQFLAQHPRIQAYRFPGYAPELNPDEFVWAQLKRSLANSVPKDIFHLHSLLRAPTQRLRRSQKLLRSCLHASSLSW